MLQTLLRSNKELALLLIKTQREVFSRLSGESISKKRGQGYDFMELREYESGDDIRHIDWIISAKATKPYVKIFHQNRALEIATISLLDASMDFGTKRLKKDLLIEVTALITYSCVKQQNAFESYICSDTLFLSAPKTKQLYGVRALAEKLDAFDAIQKNLDYSLLPKLHKLLQNKKILFFIGDFLGAQVQALKSLNVKHEVVVIILRDRFEEEPIAVGDLRVSDSTQNKTAQLRFNSANIKEYRAKIVHNDEKLYQELKYAGITFTKIYTDENPFKKIMQLLESR